MARECNAPRAVSHNSAAVWRSAFEPYLDGGNRILDVGAGTGRFAVLIAQWFGTDPQAECARSPLSRANTPIVSYVEDALNSFHSDQTCLVLLFSQTFITISPIVILALKSFTEFSTLEDGF